MLLRGFLVFVLPSLLAVNAHLWTKGVVHYAINRKDYDAHSQDLIGSVLSRLEKEVCLKFFNTPLNFNATTKDKILYISNKDQRKACPPDNYDYSGSVVDLTIGYKCLNEHEIARIIVDMLRASAQLNVSPVNSFDLVQKFQEKTEEPGRPTLLSLADRRFINAHYAHECSNLNSHPALHPSYRRSYDGSEQDELTAADALQMSEENREYYNQKLWPLGIVMFGIQDQLRDSADHELLKYAMTSIELESCVIFQEAVDGEGVLAPRNLIWFSTEGADAPALGFQEGNQSVNLHSAMAGAGGHLAHPIMNLMRAAGVPMASNRPDRDNYLEVHWQNIEKGKEHYLEKFPEEAWLKQLPYDFNSATHAAANFVCNEACDVGETTVKPLQDHLWQRTMSIGHTSQLSDTDRLYLKTIYGNECQKRSVPASVHAEEMVGAEYTGNQSKEAAKGLQPDEPDAAREEAPLYEDELDDSEALRKGPGKHKRGRVRKLKQ